MRYIPFAFALFLSLACAKTEPAVAKAAEVYGGAFTVEKPVSISTLGDPAAYLGKTVQVEGEVTQVCQNKGCWMELTDAERKTKVRVLAKDHSFSVPKGSTGRRAVALGVLSAPELPEAEAAHYAEEAGQPAPKGPTKELQLEATGVVFL
jgi:hypothetical protein